MFEGRADPDSDLIIACTHVSAWTTGYFGGAYPDFAELVDGLPLPGGLDGPDKDGGPSEGGPGDGGGKPGPDDEAAEPDASDDLTPSSDDWTAFSADEFGVSLSWDGAIWSYEGGRRGAPPSGRAPRS